MLNRVTIWSNYFGKKENCWSLKFFIKIYTFFFSQNIGKFCCDLGAYFLIFKCNILYKQLLIKIFKEIKIDLLTPFLFSFVVYSSASTCFGGVNGKFSTLLHLVFLSGTDWKLIIKRKQNLFVADAILRNTSLLTNQNSLTFLLFLNEPINNEELYPVNEYLLMRSSRYLPMHGGNVSRQRTL